MCQTKKQRSAVAAFLDLALAVVASAEVAATEASADDSVQVTAAVVEGGSPATAATGTSTSADAGVATAPDQTGEIVLGESGCTPAVA